MPANGDAQAAIDLRQRIFEGSIAIVGDRPDMSYERPRIDYGAMI